jgi:hypothetical protein
MYFVRMVDLRLLDNSVIHSEFEILSSAELVIVLIREPFAFSDLHSPTTFVSPA